MINALMLHFVKDRCEADNFGSMPFASTEEVMDLLSSLNARGLLATRVEFENAISNGFYDESEKYVLTFDDGYTDHYNMFKRVQGSFDVAMTFFVTGCTLFGQKLLVNIIQYFVIFFEGDWCKVNRMLDDFILKEKLLTAEQMRVFDDKLKFDPSYDGYLVVRFKRYMQQIPSIEKAVQFLRQLENVFSSAMIGARRRNLFWSYFYMNRAQLNEIFGRGAYIGYHSWSHGHLTHLSEHEIYNEVAMPSWWPWSEMFCYPYGSYNDEVVKQVAQSGYSHAFTVDHGSCNIDSDPFKLPRVDIREALLSQHGG